MKKKAGQQVMSKLLIKNTYILTMTEEKLTKGDILIDGQFIVAVGQVPASMFTDDQVEILDGTNCLTMPGLVNTHTHAGMTLLRSYADDMELMPWLNDAIWPAEAKMTDEHIYWGSKLAMVEMIRSGTTAFADMYSSMEEVARAVSETGVRANLARGCLAITDHDDNSIKESRTLFDHWHNSADGRIKVWLAPHSPYTCPPDYLAKLVNLAKELKTGLHIHVAETTDEINQIAENYQRTPVEYLLDNHVFDVPVLAAHCVYINDNDMTILAQHHAAVAHNPASNMKLASGIAPIAAMLEKGITVGLGTDGTSSNNSLNLFRDMSICSFLHKVNLLDPTALKAYDVLKMATIGGAKALGWEQEIGTLVVGKKADIIMVDLDKPHFCPWNNVIADLVYSAQGSDVKNSIIDGKIVMKNYQLPHLDVREIYQKTYESAQAIK